MSAFGGGASSGPAPDGPQSGSTSMFVVFALAVYTLLLVPYTIVKLKAAAKGGEEDVSKPWVVRRIGLAVLFFFRARAERSAQGEWRPFFEGVARGTLVPLPILAAHLGMGAGHGPA